MSGRVVLRVGPDDVGSRVVLRRVAPGGRYVDLLGELVRWDADAVEVRDRHGVKHRVAPADVVAGKRVPPAPARRA